MARKRGVRDYSREIWQEAVQCYLRVIGDENRKWVQKYKRVLAPENGRRGGKPSFYQQAHADLKHRVFTDSCDSDRVNGMSDKMFRDVVKRHICGVVKQGTCYRRRRTQPEGPTPLTREKRQLGVWGPPCKMQKDTGSIVVEQTRMRGVPASWSSVTRLEFSLIPWQGTSWPSFHTSCAVVRLTSEML